MDEIIIPDRQNDSTLFKHVVAQNDGPAFARRARRVQGAFEDLLGRCRRQRDEWLEMTRMRLGMLYALAGDWAALHPLLGEEQASILRALHTELNPQLRLPVEPTRSQRTLRRTFQELRESMAFFNRRWQEYLGTVDLTALNRLREDYNRYYLVEKECAVRSPRVARQGYRPLTPLTVEELMALLPLLPVPSSRDQA